VQVWQAAASTFLEDLPPKSHLPRATCQAARELLNAQACIGAHVRACVAALLGEEAPGNMATVRVCSALDNLPSTQHVPAAHSSPSSVVDLCSPTKSTEVSAQHSEAQSAALQSPIAKAFERSRKQAATSPGGVSFARGTSSSKGLTDLDVRRQPQSQNKLSTFGRRPQQTIMLKTFQEDARDHASQPTDDVSAPAVLSHSRQALVPSNEAHSAAHGCAPRGRLPIATGRLQPVEALINAPSHLQKVRKEGPEHRARKRLRDIVNGIVDSDGEDSGDNSKLVLGAKKASVKRDVGPNLLTGGGNAATYKRARLRNPDAVRLSAQEGAHALIFACVA
jgi:hypothetical protein